MRSFFLSLCFGIGITTAGAQTYSFTTLAGTAGSSTTNGYVNGTGSVARFSWPASVAADAAGNVYVADTSNHAIRKVTPSGFVTTLAGGDSPTASGLADGFGNAAHFNAPQGLAVDAAGNLYVADTNNQLIRKVTAAGLVSTVAGSPGATGATDGTGESARFSFPEGVAVDGAGNLYVADTQTYTIRKISPPGVVTTLAGLAYQQGNVDATGSSARFGALAGLTVDAAGTVYVCDIANNTIRKVTSAGNVTTLAGHPSPLTGAADGVGASATFNEPQGLTLDAAGNLYVADTNNHLIRRVTPVGVVTTIAGLAGTPGSSDGPAAHARFNSPRGIGADPFGNLLIADTNNHTIRKLSQSGEVTTLAGLPTINGTDGLGAAARFCSPAGVALDTAGNAYVADSRNHTIRRVTPDGAVTLVAGRFGENGSADGPSSQARFKSPNAVAVDRIGNVYVGDTGNCSIRKITPEGFVSTLAGKSGEYGAIDGPGTTARFSWLSDLALDSAGNLYVADSATVRKVTSAGVVSTLAGSAGQVGILDGVGSAAQFGGYPMGLTVDAAGQVFVADTSNNTIRQVSPAGTVVTIAGKSVFQGHGLFSAYTVDGVGTDARFANPAGIAVDRFGNLYVTERATIRRLTPIGASNSPTWVVTTLGGNPASDADPSSVDGVGSAARFNFPTGIAVDQFGRLIVADTHNDTIRLGQPTSLGSKLVNLSARARAENGSDGTLIIGFQLSGSSPRSLLVRAVGPTLANFGVTGVLSNPALSLNAFSGGNIADNDDWNGDPEVSAAVALSRAFALPAASRDAALVRSLSPRGYTALVSGGAGITLVESYDADTSSDSRLVNLSCRARVGIGDDILIAGFVISGDTPKRVLLRAIGPTLASYGVAGTLAQPRLQLFLGPALLGENRGWGGDAGLVDAFKQTGAFTLPASSPDCALLATLTPGVYSVQVSGMNSTTGVALVEIYEVP